MAIWWWNRLSRGFSTATCLRLQITALKGLNKGFLGSQGGWSQTAEVGRLQGRDRVGMRGLKSRNKGDRRTYSGIACGKTWDFEWLCFEFEPELWIGLKTIWSSKSLCPVYLGFLDSKAWAVPFRHSVLLAGLDRAPGPVCHGESSVSPVGCGEESVLNQNVVFWTSFLLFPGCQGLKRFGGLDGRWRLLIWKFTHFRT